MPVPSRLAHVADARRAFGDKADRLIPFYLQGDPLADAALDALERFPPAQRRTLLEEWLETPRPTREDMPPEVARLLEQVSHVPFWVDHARCSRGGEAFLRTGVLGGIVLGFGALAASYCSSGGNKPLVFTRRLLDDAYRRMAETGDFIYTVSQPGALQLGAAGWRAVVRVRMIHARVRRGLLASPAWRSQDWGLPINQADMAVTVLLFSSVLARGVRRLGGPFSEQEEDDLVHLWRYAGYLLGVHDELLCATAEEAAEYVRLIDTLDAGPDEDSRRLLAAMFDPDIFRQRIPNPRVAESARSFYMALCRYLLGDARADALELPRTPLDFAVRGVRPWLRIVSYAASALPFASYVRLASGKSYWQRFIVDGLATRSRDLAKAG